MSELRPISFRQCWREFVASGALASLHSHAALAVYLAYSAHADNKGLAWLSTKSIMRASGLSEDSVGRGRAACVSAGYLADVGWRARCKLYLVKIAPATTRDSAGGREARPPATYGPTTPDIAGSSTRKSAADYPQKHPPKVEEGRIEGSSKGNAAAGAVSTDAAAEALRARTQAFIAELAQAHAVIAEPVLSLLASDPHLTPAIARQEAEKVRGTDKGTGNAGVCHAAPHLDRGGDETTQQVMETRRILDQYHANR